LDICQLTDAAILTLFDVDRTSNRGLDAWLCWPRSCASRPTSACSKSHFDII
jgi:hypothetical protein